MSPRNQSRIDTAVGAAVGGLIPVLGLLGLLVGFGDRIWVTKEQAAQVLSEAVRNHNQDVSKLVAADGEISQRVTRIEAKIAP